MSDPEARTPAVGNLSTRWRRLSCVVFALNCLGLLAGVVLLASATSITNIALVVIFAPTLGAEAVLLGLMTLIAGLREQSRRARISLVASLVGSLGLAILAAVINACYGAKW